MTTVKKVCEVLKQIGCTYNIMDTGDPSWKRLFIIRDDGCQIGRISFKDREIFSIKNYKKDYIREIDETDYVFIRLSRWLKDGTILSRETIDGLVHQAAVIAENDLAAKKNWRESNPKKGRKKLTGKNIRHILTQLCHK